MKYLVLLLLVFVSAAGARNYQATIEFNAGVVTGCGYIPNELVTIKYMWNSTGSRKEEWNFVKTKVPADSGGCFTDLFTPSEPGYYQIWTTQQNQHSNQDIDMAMSMIEFVI